MDLALDNQQWLICHKSKAKQSKPTNRKSICIPPPKKNKNKTKQCPYKKKNMQKTLFLAKTQGQHIHLSLLLAPPSVFPCWPLSLYFIARFYLSICLIESVFLSLQASVFPFHCYSPSLYFLSLLMPDCLSLSLYFTSCLSLSFPPYLFFISLLVLSLYLLDCPSISLHVLLSILLSLSILLLAPYTLSLLDQKMFSQSVN